MDKNAIRKYAMWARNELIERVCQKAEQYEITKDKITSADADSIGGRVLSGIEKKQRQALIGRINKVGYEQVMEEVAYTWFNRFTALRFMEVNNYLPSHTRVFTNEKNEFKPQILVDAIQLDIDGLSMGKVYELKDANKTEELYKYLLITQCNALSSVLPVMFQKIEDYTELLLPDYLLREGSVIEQMITIIPEGDWTEQVEIIGWLYQFYINDPKDKLINARSQYQDKDIPYVTQLFTSDWIVKYMVENSLGRLWEIGHPGISKQNEWKYYLESGTMDEDRILPGQSDFENQMRSIDPKTIKCIDPCMGSGHIIVYVFDALIKIYENYGYSIRDAVESIIENNIFGIDIDERATQLAYFSIMMKARQYDRRFLTRGIQPHVYTIKSSLDLDNETVAYFCGDDNDICSCVEKIINTFKPADVAGSLLCVEPFDYGLLKGRMDSIRNGEDISLYSQNAVDSLFPIIEAAHLLSEKYNVVITNPPYMNWTYMPSGLKEFIQANYADYKSDLFSAFANRVIELCSEDGQIGLLMPYVWMFLASYEKLRVFVNSNTTITSLVQLEYNAFEAACVPVAALTLSNNTIHSSGEYVQLSEFRGSENQAPKTLEAVANRNCGYRYTTYQKSFEKMPGMPFAYWLSDTLYSIFGESKTIGDYGDPKKGLSTGENKKFLRLWHEVDLAKCLFESEGYSEPYKWIPLNKGGDYRKWYGNNNYVINWAHNGDEIKSFKGSVIRNEKYYFRKSLTWTMLSSSCLGIRASEPGKIFEGAGPSLFVDDEYYYYLMGLLCSKLGLMIINIFNPTMNININDIANIPVKIDYEQKEKVESIVKESIGIAKADWDSFERSWNFKRSPLVRKVNLIEKAFQEWERECNERYRKLKENEEELNRIFINMYGLQDSISPEVEDKDITLSLADRERDVKALISYSVGCMFGRYSLVDEGIRTTVDATESDSIYETDTDNIIPICDDEYFDDDIVNRFIRFISTVYGNEKLEDNLLYIAKTLGGKGTSREIIRGYFLNSFYSDHCDTFSVSGSGKRPIYWMFDSGKKNAFKCLVYIHRYKPDLIARIRTDYVHEQQSRYRTAIETMEKQGANSQTSDRLKIEKNLKLLREQADELRSYEEKVHHIADQMISINLDDGVISNYEKFKEILAKLK